MKLSGLAALYSWLALLELSSSHKDQTHVSHYLIKEEAAKSFLTGSTIRKRSADLCVNGEGYCESNKLECSTYTERSREAYCKPNSCPSGTTCYMSTPCPKHYAIGCDANACLAVPCKNGATCKSVGTSYTCACTRTYYGQTCTYVDRCLSNPCGNGGTCARTGSNFNCGCTNEYQGPTCQQTSPCHGQPCKNGATCQIVGTSYKCTCISGFYGTSCDNVDKCLSNPCVNGGTCTRIGSNFNCGCTNEYQGPTCQQTSLCYGQPCKNGATCQHAGTSYTCTCTSGFYGTNCDNLDRCLSKPCVNGGTCTRIGSNFNCGCTNEYQGMSCQHQSPCHGQPCRNGATCQNSGTNYTCTCTSGIYGINCDYVDRCLSNPCVNGGTCTRIGSNFNCGCTNEYQGTSCQHQSPCHGQPCEHGATCQYAGTNYTCACTSGFYGVDCEYDDTCLGSPCTNGATCNRVGSNYTCSCTDRYTGSRCTEDCRPGPADIIIVLDASISAEIVFNASKAFVASFVGGLAIGSGEFRIAMLTYSFDVHVEFGFNTHTNRTSLLAAIANVSGTPGPSYLHKALTKAREMLPNKYVTGVKQYVLLLSDGLSTRRQEAIMQSRLLKSYGVTVLCVGIGSQVAQEELLQIATDTPYVFSPGNDDVLNAILMETAAMSCTDCVINKVSDIVLLVDVSKYQTGQLQKTLDIVKYFIQHVRAYFSDTRIAMVTFDDRQHVKFSLNDHLDTDSILVNSQIGIATSDRQSDVNAALEFARTAVFTGARTNCRKFAVVFSNEGWTDVNAIVRERKALNMDNVTVAFVPVGPSAELDTVFSVANQASDVYYIGQYEEEHDEERLKALISQTSHVECVPDLFVKRQ